MQLGVDTHKKTHVLVALDDEGRQLGTRATPNTPEGTVRVTATRPSGRLVRYSGHE